MSLSSITESFLRRLESEDIENVVKSLWYGIEIEFADCGDLGGGEKQECPYDEDDAESSLNNGDPVETLVAHLAGNSSRDSYAISREILDNLSLEDAINGCTRHSWSNVVQSELDSMCENWEPDSGGDGEFRDVSGWEHCEDGTSGIVREYKTDEPINLTEMVERINDLMNEAGACDVPLNGSCHVHVSVPNAKHTASDKSYLHCCILYELSQFVPFFPRRLMDRLRSSHSSYFHLDGQPTTKYTAVSFHHQGSVEFRLFGGLTDPDHIADCVRWAGLAFLRGYARFHRGDYAINDIQTFRTAFKTAVLDGKAMSRTLIQFDVSEFIGSAIGDNSETDTVWSSGHYATALSDGFANYYSTVRPVSPAALEALAEKNSTRLSLTVFVTRCGDLVSNLRVPLDDPAYLYSPNYGYYIPSTGQVNSSSIRYRRYDIVDVECVPELSSENTTQNDTMPYDNEWHNALVESAMFRDAIEHPERYEFQRRDGRIVVLNVSGRRGQLRDESSRFVYSTNHWGHSYISDEEDGRDLVSIRHRVTALSDNL
jgi:hypothetical protein